VIAGMKPDVAAGPGARLADLTERQRKWAGIGGLGLVLVIAIIFPLVFTNATVSNLAVVTVIFVAVASAWNIFSGYSGYLSLGHAIFFGTGAYATGILANHWQLNGYSVFALLPLAGLIATVLAVPIGLVALRVRRHTFVVVTIAFFFIVQLSASNLSFTGGTSGIFGPVPNWSPDTFNDPFYYVGLGIAIGTIVLSFLIRRSRFGLQLRAIRDDEDRAVGLGVRAMPVKLSAFAISAFITAMAGGLWFFFLGSTYPAFAFDPLFDLAIVLMAFFGGLGTVAGPVLGALVLEPLQLYLNQRLTNDYLSEILLGVLFLAIILFMPRGVLPTASEFITAQRARKADG
jgi:ABC-type branched-subunit amino acid transport system permease subunit